MGVFHKVWNLNNLMKSQWKSYDDLKELQNKKLKAIVKYAYESIPFYHEKFKKAEGRPSEIKTVDDLKKLPHTTKSEIQANFPNARPHEMIKEEYSGLSVPPTEPTLMAKAIIKLTNDKDLGLRLGQQARLSMLTRYNWNLVIDKI